MALQPSNATITVDGNEFNAYSAHVGIETEHDYIGMPVMGSSHYVIDCAVNTHDTENMPFEALKRLFELAHIVTKDKIVDIKVQFWADERQDDAVCTYSFRGWISQFHTTGGGESNHTLHMTFVPELARNQYVDLSIGN